MRTLVLQRGHVPHTTGSTGTPGEQQLATEVAAHAVDLADRYKLRVRVIDADVPLDAYRGDRFVALHADGAGNTTARGAHYGYRTGDGQRFGAAWQDAHRAAGWPGVFRAPNGTANLASYYGTRHAVAVGNRHAIIVELGFLTNPGDRAWLVANPGRCAHAVLAAAAGTPVQLSTGGQVAAGDPPIVGGTPDLEHPETVMAQLSTVTRDDTGADVRRAQAWLAAAKLPPADTFDQAGVPDGVFGFGTDDAVRHFQDRHGLAVDGIVGPNTWAKLAGVRR